MYYFIKKFHWTVEEYKQTDIKDLEVLFTIQNMISKKEQLDLQSNKNK